MKQNFFQNCTLRFICFFFWGGGDGVLFKNNSCHYYFILFTFICQNKTLKEI